MVDWIVGLVIITIILKWTASPSLLLLLTQILSLNPELNLGSGVPDASGKNHLHNCVSKWCSGDLARWTLA